MKLLILALIATVSFSNQVLAEDITCEAAKGSVEKIFIKLDDVDFAAGTVKRYSTSILLESREWENMVPDFEAGSNNGENLSAVPYKGTKYKGHIKFDLDNRGWAGNFSPDKAELIISPEFKVVKTIPQQNNWDQTWTWDIEVRKHSAVLDASWSDHHGDYIKLDCYSIEKVNDSKGN